MNSVILKSTLGVPAPKIQRTSVSRCPSGHEECYLVVESTLVSGAETLTKSYCSGGHDE